MSIEFEEEHKRLLRAQVITADNLRDLSAAQLHTERRLDALIAVVDDLVRNRRTET